MSQLAAIKKHFEAGHSLTPLEALGVFGCFRLAARVLELKERHDMPITTTMHTDATGKKYARYRKLRVGDVVAISGFGGEQGTIIEVQGSGVVVKLADRSGQGGCSASECSVVKEA